MKISIMREYVRLAANRNYSKTADELYIAQSALSRHMVALEEELNAKLINRDRNAFELTPAGELVLEDFQKILAQYENTLAKLARLGDVESGELRLGYLYYDSDFYIAKIRDAFRKNYPRVKLTLIPYQPSQLESDLLSGKIDAALEYGLEGNPRRDIEYMPFLKIPYTLIYSPSHRFSQLKDITIADLDGEKLLVPEAPFQLNRVSDQWSAMLQHGGARIWEEIPLNNFDEVPWLLDETGAIYCSPMVNRNPYGAQVECRLLQPDLYHSDVSVVWLKNQVNPAVRLLCSAIRICYP